MRLATLTSPNCMPPNTAATRSNLNSPTRPQLSPPTIVRIAAAARSSSWTLLLSRVCQVLWRECQHPCRLSRVCTEMVDCLYSTGVNEQQRHQPRPIQHRATFGSVRPNGPGSVRSRSGVEQRHGPSSRHGRREAFGCSAADEARVQRMQSLVSGGLAAAQAADLILSREPAPGMVLASATILDQEAGNLSVSLDRLDEQAANTALDRLFSPIPSRQCCRTSCCCTCTGWGSERRSRGLGRAQEHFASNLLRGRLLGLAQGWVKAMVRAPFSACSPGEQHELGLLVFGVALSRRGWRIIYSAPTAPSARSPTSPAPCRQRSWSS